MSDKVRTLSLPKTLRFCQELNTLALAQKRDRELLLWTLLRDLNDTGSGQLDLPPATDFLIKLGCSRRTLYRHLSHGEGPNRTFAKPTIETFFEVSIAPASSFQRGQANDHS